ncbi:negative regulation of GTP binding, variant 2 [Dermatophagoides farinae]|uniref:Negative regulation of GTP binding, variant 2 n=1 Tax=Dermatophagoides farinae TaxID=6954 RepID=A0A922HMU4_DERFA|nr:negative regulation of GTP binding, variant 2 [Dermatophagoides farinae]
MFDSSSSSSSMKINTANNLARITYIDDDSSYDDDDDGVDICIDSLDLNVFDIDNDGKTLLENNKTIKKLNVFKNDDYSDDDDDNEIEKLPVINEDPLEQQQQQPFQQNPQLCINNDRMIITTATNVSSPSINDDDVNSMQTSSSKLMGKKRISSKLNSNAHRLRRFFIGNGPRSSSISNHVSNNDGRSVRIKYFKYNASYRKAQRGKHRQPIIYQLLEPIPVRKEEFPSSIININNNNNNNNNHGHQQKIDQSKSSKMPTNQFLMEQASLIYEDFGVQFINRNHKYLIELAFQQQQSLTYCEDFTKNLAGTVQELALRVLQTDVNRLQQQLFRLSPLSMNCESINIVADTNSSSYIIPMPNFSKNRKTFPSLISKNENRSIIIFGGNLTTLHVRDNERNKKDLDVPSILKHMIDYLGDNGVQEEGIFRVPGTKNRLNKLEEELTDLYMNYYKLNKPDNSKEINTIFERYNVHDVASLLKLFIRRLSPPLLTNELMDIFLMVPKIPNIFVSIKILNLLMLTLNDTHRNSLNALLILSNKVVRFMNYNLISLDGIATLLAANLFDCGSLSYNRNNPNQTSPAMNGVNQKRPSISTATTTTIESMMIGSPIQGAGGGGVGVGGSPKQSSIDHHRTSVSSQLVNEISMEMATQLERTQNSLFVLKLLINLQPILFHLPPYLERQIHEKVEEKKVQINQLFNT